MYNCKLLQWTKHFDEKCKKVSSVKPTLRKAELYVLQKILLTMYVQFVRAYNCRFTVRHDSTKEKLISKPSNSSN